MDLDMIWKKPYKKQSRDSKLNLFAYFMRSKAWILITLDRVNVWRAMQCNYKESPILCSSEKEAVVVFYH